jgi:uncharacterized membrane protein YeaQ/YmgE (transglycosylase-associated protein family)
MESKSLIYLGSIIGGVIGGYVPTLWGASPLSFSAIICSAIGGILGIYIFFKISR